MTTVLPAIGQPESYGHSRQLPPTTFEHSGLSGAIVYFVHDPETGLTKIGTAFSMKRLPERIREHERATGHILTLLGAMLGGRAKEREIHLRLRASRQRTEWFWPSDELAEIVLALPIPPTEFPISIGAEGLRS